MTEVKTNYTTSNTDLPEPFMGRMILEIMRDNAMDYKRKALGMSADSLIQLPDLGSEQAPLKKGKILKQSNDCFGERYKKHYGNDSGPYPTMGDIVMFIPNQQYNLTPDGKYCIIADEHVIAFEKGN